MFSKFKKYALWGILILVMLLIFDYGMRKQHEIDCAQGRYCGV